MDARLAPRPGQHHGGTSDAQPSRPDVAKFDYEDPGGSESTAVGVHWLAVQRMDFAAIDEIARLRAELAAMGHGPQGGPGPGGTEGAQGEPGRLGDDAPRAEGRSAAAGGGATSRETDAAGGSTATRERKGSAPFAGRAGSVEVPLGGQASVAFSTALADDRYAISLRPRNPAPGGSRLEYTDKSPTGFTVIVHTSEPAPPSAGVMVDWIAVPFASP